MTFRQKLMKLIYPLILKFGKKKISANEKVVAPPEPVYNLQVTLNNGKVLPMASFKGKKVLLVNTASNCGYTNQYEELQALYQKFEGKLEIIGFPANDFKEQEKGSDEEIASFCQVNFGVRFPLAKKSSVVKGDEQNAVFNWLSNKNKNGWNDEQPVWNFTKYLLNENGVLTHRFEPSVSPLSDELTHAVEE